MTKTMLGVIALLVCSGLAACERKETLPSVSFREEAAAPAGAEPAFQGSGSVSGKVMYGGDAVEPDLLQTGADPICTQQNPEGLKSEELLVEGGGLQNVFVYIKSGLEEKSYPVPQTPVILDQSACRYNPHVLGLQVQQTIRIKNSDGTLHNVNAMAKASKAFNLGMPLQGMTIEKKFTAPEVMVKFKCDVHPWMTAYIGVLPHPYFAVTAADGSYQIANLPAGRYLLGFWHEKLGDAELPIEVAPGQSLSADMTLGKV